MHTVTKTLASQRLGAFSLARWQAQHGYTYDTAAKALGVCRASYARHLKLEREGKPLPPLVELACKAVYIEKKDSKK